MIHGTHNALDDPRNEDIVIYVNGDLLPRDQAKISVFDSGYLVGDGIWDAVRLHNGVLVFLEEHMNRLFQGAKAIDLDIGLNKDQLTNLIWKTVNANKMQSDVHVRFMITRGNKKTPSQDPRLTVKGPTIVIIAEYKMANPLTKEKGIKLFTSTIRRGSPDYLDPKLNCHSKLHEVIALNQALHAGADEALMLDINGFVSTCNATNFFMVKNNEVWTSTGQYCLNGVTRAKVIKVCKDNNIVIKEKNFSLTEVYDADESFVTGTFGSLTPVIEVDGKIIGSGKYGEMTRKLSEFYLKEIQSYVKTHKGKD